MKNLIYFLLFSFSLTAVNGQGWERLYPLGTYDVFSTGDLIPTPDGGFLLNSRVQSNPPPFDSVHLVNYFYKLAADGTLQWQKHHEELFGAPVVAMWPVETNRLLFVTLKNDTTRLVKTDANLQIIWSQVLDAEGQVGYKTRLQAVAGGYAVIYQKIGQQSQPLRVIKTNLNGTVLWQNDYTSGNNFYSFHDFVTNKQGDLYLFGSGWTGNNVSIVSKISAGGTLVFEQIYTQPVTTFSPVLLNDNLLAFMDFQKIYFIDGNGQSLNTVDLAPLQVPVYRMAATADGNLLLTTQNALSTLFKITPQGTVLWSQSCNNLQAAYPKGVFALWSLADQGAVIFFVDASGVRPYYVVRTDAQGQVYTNQVHGHLFADVDHNCTETSGLDFPAPAVSIIAQEGNDFYYATTDSFGNYALTLDTGTYLLRVLPPGGSWQACTDSLVVTFSAYDTLEWSTGISSTFNCPWPGVNLSAPFLRRCFTSDYQVAYGNGSDVTADSAVVTLTLDSFLHLQTASLPYTSLGNNVYQFLVGDLTPLQTGSFRVTVDVDCAAQLGQTHCSSAEISIANPCPTLGLETPIIQVMATCEGDSVAFKIRNVGGAPMTGAAEFVIIEDLIIMRQGQFQLPQQAEQIIKCPANGATSRIYAGQAPGEPPFFATTTAIEGCNGPIQPGYWNMYPEIFARQDIFQDCQPNIGSFDPNDKQAVPTGYDTEHYIGRNVPLDYKIRFQNTGTDTAFTVVVRDTLSPWLDAASLRPGAASHPYSWQLLGAGVVQFTFANIRLSDSLSNPGASQGFISFHIDQKPELPLQTLIGNRAAIFFDFNAPVLTNTTFHRVGEKFVVVSAWEPKRTEVLIQASPNPFAAETRLEVKGLRGTSSLRLQVFDLQGKQVAEMTSGNGVFLLKKEGLESGMYLFNVQQNGLLVGRGKLVVE